MSTNGAAFLTVGHVTSDLIAGSEVPGGSALYSAVQARALGAQTRLLTAATGSWPGRPLVEGVDLHALRTSETTTFEYLSVTPRLARLRAAARPLTPGDLPPGWARSEIALLCPVFAEVEPSFAEALSADVLGIGAQGWMRRLGPGDRVERGPWRDPGRALEQADVVFFSVDDADDADRVAARLGRRVGTVILTRGAEGCSVFLPDRRIDVPAFPALEIDPTGAGDVFAAAYLIAAWEGAAPREAATFAGAAAAFAVEGPGVSGIRGREAIAARRGGVSV